MARYIVLYYASQAAMEATEHFTPDDMKKGMDDWMAWAERCGERLVDMGAPLSGGQRVTNAGGMPSDRGVMMYSILDAENMEAARALLVGHPHLDWHEGCEIEVHETMPLPM